MSAPYDPDARFPDARGQQQSSDPRIAQIQSVSSQIRPLLLSHADLASRRDSVLPSSHEKPCCAYVLRRHKAVYSTQPGQSLVMVLAWRCRSGV